MLVEPRRGSGIHQQLAHTDTGREVAASIREVADRAGVSIATVSRVLSGADPVSEELSTRVRDAARELRYRPNRVARRLRRVDQGTWALIVPDLGNRFFTSIARGVEDVAAEHDITLFVGNTADDPHRLRRFISTALAERVAGLIVAPSHPEAELEDVLETGTPVVLVDQYLTRYPDVATVMTDHLLGGQLAGQHLLSMGCRRVGVIAGPRPDPSWNGRLAGIGSVSGLEIVASERGDNKVQGGIDAASALLDSDLSLDGLFVTNNLMTIGVLRELDRRGVRVPEDLAVVGYDLNSEEWYPAPVPAVNQDPCRIGEIAARLLLSPGDDRSTLEGVRLDPPLLLLGPELDCP